MLSTFKIYPSYDSKEMYSLKFTPGTYDSMLSLKIYPKHTSNGMFSL